MLYEKRVGKLVIAVSASVLTLVLLFGTAYANHQGYTHAPAGFINAADPIYGNPFNNQNVTPKLQAAIDTGLNVFVPKMVNNWFTDRLFLTNDNQTIRLEEGVVLEAVPNLFGPYDSNIFRAESVQNIRLEGYGATLRMRQDDYANPPYIPSEHRVGIALFDVTNFEVLGLTIEDTGGDGIYLGTRSETGFNKDVTIKDVVIDNAYRNGIGVISVENLLIDNTVIINTSGTAPQAGIDFEPNFAGQRLTNITVRNSVIASNGSTGILWQLSRLIDNGASSTGLLENVTIDASGIDGLVITEMPLLGWDFRDSLVINQGDDGFDVGNGFGTESIEYSAFWGNADDNFTGDVVAGTGTITNTAPIFVNTTDPADPLYYYLDPSTSTLISLGASDGSFMGARGVAGDFDEDADVTGFDFLSWQRGESPNAGSADDLAAWETYFGAVGSPALGAGVGAVPEPSTSLLLLVGVGLGCLRRSRR